jgi:hypothetical protein
MIDLKPERWHRDFLSAFVWKGEDVGSAALARGSLEAGCRKDKDQVVAGCGRLDRSGGSAARDWRGCSRGPYATPRRAGPASTGSRITQSLFAAHRQHRRRAAAADEKTKHVAGAKPVHYHAQRKSECDRPILFVQQKYSSCPGAARSGCHGILAKEALSDQLRVIDEPSHCRETNLAVGNPSSK